MARAEAERLAADVPKEPYYAGRWRAARGAAAFDVVDPVTERCIATVAEAGSKEVAGKIKAGAVAVNGWSPLDPALPWGGTRLSGHGRDLGWAGIEASTEEKTVTVVL